VSTEGRLSLRVIVLLIALSAPLALAIETLFRVHVLGRIIGPALDEVRSHFSPTTTRVAWVMVGVTVVAGLLGLVATRAALRKLAREPDTAQRMRRLIDRTLLLTSIPQVPAVFATFCFTAGAELLPVLVSMVISTGFVLVQGFGGERVLEQASEPPH
jgi:hypothetical protein